MDRYEEKLSALLSDTEFEKMELHLKLPNIFSALSISRTEIRHSNFLSWILNPNGSHAMGDLLLRKFLREIFKDDSKNKKYSYFDVDLFDLRNIEIRREWKNIDLLVIHDKFVITIENKVDSTDHSNQLNRYKDIIDNTFPEKDRIYVYMTPFGNDPNDELAGNSYINYSYLSLCVSIEQIIEIYNESINSKVIDYLKDYIVILRREIMENDELNTIANKIYNAHKEAIDFIIENKPDIYTELYPFFESKVNESNWIIGSKNKGYIRFLTQKLKRVIPHGKSNTYSEKESFLFEIDFRWDPKNIVFQTIISPHPSEYKIISEILSKALDNVEGHKKPKGKKYIIHFKEKYPFNVSDISMETDEQIKQSIEKFWPKIEKIVENVELEILKYKEELKKYTLFKE